MESYKIDINEHIEGSQVEWRAVALICSVWHVEQCNGDWKPFPASEFVIMEDN